MSELMQIFGVGHQLTWKGRTWQLAPFKNHLRARFEAWLVNQALKRVEQFKGDVDPITYRERLQAMMAVVGGKNFEAGNESFNDALKSVEGATQVLFLRVHENHPDFTEALAAEMAAEKWDEVAVRLHEQDADPTTAAGKKTAASPSPSAP